RSRRPRPACGASRPTSCPSCTAGEPPRKPLDGGRRVGIRRAMAYRLLALTAVLSALLAGAAAAQTCNLNPNGPDELLLPTASGRGTASDVGPPGAYHNFAVPGGAEFAACLNNCDTTTDPVCDVQGYASGQSAAGRGFLPPIPIVIGSSATCVATTFR